MKQNNLNEKYRGVNNFTPDELVYYLKKGYNASDLAKLFKTTTNVIEKALVEYEIDPPHVTTKEVLYLYRAGTPTAVIADKLNITPLAVFYKLVKSRKVSIKQK
jgi:uncharacterized protein (DUF433 family)